MLISHKRWGLLKVTGVNHSLRNSETYGHDCIPLFAGVSSLCVLLAVVLVQGHTLQVLRSPCVDPGLVRKKRKKKKSRRR